ncbi:Colicin V production protein [Microbacterium sp. cf046]|uniref:MarP family serine protease n=1 Tax=Microbacterium sp. cf046 TaxID=1761803 RepID=UPI0008E7FE3D|nr:MarP family serine protease [Microbacterium sp. cf046]SFS08368.1 Colicin V production protein [Microbacterium sp. cf046]
MVVVDVVLIALLLVALLVGVQRGLLASLGVLIGIVLGGVAAFWLVPIVNDVWPWQNSRVVVVIGLAIALLIGGAAAGGAIGGALRRGVERSAPLRVVDRVLGGVLAVLAGALSLSLIASSVAATGMPGLSTALSSSQVLRTIDALTPRPVAETLARVRSAVLDDGLPQLGVLLDLDVQPTAPPVALDDPELTAAAASVARVSGVAFACGTSASGSGFVIAPDRVVTNAHVVAGVSAPVVELPGQPAREGRIVYFDPIDDLALIAVDDLGAAALGVVEPLTPGTAAVIQGYPYGGPFTMVNAEVISAGSVFVPDIYGDSSELRDIYALAAQVHPGNSGGPLLTADGLVAGVVFARAETDADRGYAMTTSELQPVLAGASGWTSPVSTGSCTG